MKLTLFHKLHHFIIRSRWKKWIIPVCCSFPYIGSLAWLIVRDQVWIAQIMLSPLLMFLAVASLGLILARLEFRR